MNANNDTPKCVTIFALAELDFSLYTITDTQAEAERLAQCHGRDVYYLFPPNHTFYVQVRDGA
jgi:hypothetical protein